MLSGCRPEAGSPSSSSNNPSPENANSDRGDPFDNYLKTEIAPADGFDFPIGDPGVGDSASESAIGKTHNGWRVITRYTEKNSLGIQTGEDWKNVGGGESDLAQDAVAIANGRVVFAEDCGGSWGNVVILEHLFYENHERRKIRSLYARLHSLKVRKGEELKKRQPVGAVAKATSNSDFHFELRWDEALPPTYWPSSDGKDEKWVRAKYAEPSSFIAGRRRLFAPQMERSLVLVDQERYKMRFYKNGRVKSEYDISLGQAQGQKTAQGDNKTPKGMYFVIDKRRGKFDGPYGDYYGGHWIKLNYPNKYDAERGSLAGEITRRQAEQITIRWEKRDPTLENTRLGGGIGFHGWAREWSNDGPRRLSWGCVVFHLSDIGEVFNQISQGDMVVIF